MNDIYSFYQLISKYQIEIPIIQRDYAQGRDNAKAADVRNALVKKMINAVEKEDETLFFDFVYGRVDGNKFIPFDGQQRLTTLFLFHKYVFEKCQSESNCGHKGNCICNGILGRFSYATRQSSREFCDKLVQENIVPSGDRKISENIINQSWFYPDWQKDPTVMGMLTMLDEIHSQMKDKNDFKTFAEKLTSGCNCPITFHFVDMGEHKLSDETYVKMNARGKQLTPFENFKASLEQYLEGKKEENLKNRLKGEIDGKWLDLFWDVVNNGKEGEKELPDSLMMSFFNRHFMNVWQCWYATILKTDELDKFNDRIQKEMPLFPTKDDFVSFDIYSYVMDKCGVEKCLTPIFNICDALSKTDNKIKNDCQAVWNRDSNTNDKWDLFHNDTKDETYKSRAAFYALLKYYEKNQETQETQKPELAQWMRIVWNIIENYVEREESYIPALQLIDSIAKQNFNIANLGDYNGVANDQVKEEIAKAEQINGGDEWESKIIEAEKYAFFKGSIRFLFTDGDGNVVWDKFDQKWENAQKYFDENGVKDGDESYKTNAILLKAVLYHVNDFWNLIEPQKFVLDNTASTWKNNILLDQKWKSAVHKIMIGNLKIINRKDDCLMYKNLYLTNLLDYVANSQVGSRIRWHHGHRTIYPPRYDGIMLDDENRDVPFYRNRILSSMSNVSSKQRIEKNFFKGWNINFEYTKDDKSFDFQWNTDGNVYLIENNNRKEKDADSFYCFEADGIDDSEIFIKNLNTLIEDAQKNGIYEQTSEQ